MLRAFLLFYSTPLPASRPQATLAPVLLSAAESMMGAWRKGALHNLGGNDIREEFRKENKWPFSGEGNCAFRGPEVKEHRVFREQQIFPSK